MFDALAIGGATLLGGMLSANAADRASGAQSEATNRAVGEQARQFNTARTDQLPFLRTGQAATIRLRDLLTPRAPSTKVTGRVLSREEFDPEAYLNAYSDVTATGNQDWINDPYQHYMAEVQAGGWYRPAFKLGASQESPLLQDFTPGDLVNEPGYQFGLTQGNKAIENAARARGMFMSPATVKELLRYGQDYAGTKYQDAYNRDLTNRTTKFNLLSGAASGGQVAANTLSNAGQNYATNVGNLVTAGANARGAAGIAGANAYGNAIGTIGNLYMQNQYLDALKNRGGGNYYPLYGQP